MLFAEVITVQNIVFRGSEKKDMSPDIQSNKNSTDNHKDLLLLASYTYSFLLYPPSCLSGTVQKLKAAHRLLQKILYH